MTEKLQYKVDFGLALGIIVFCWLTVKASLQIEDGPLISIYGYPYYWLWWDPAQFKILVINPLSLFANFTLYIGTIGVAGSFLAFWGRYITFMIILRFGLWILAVVSMIHFLSFFYHAGVTIEWALPAGNIFGETWYILKSIPF
ncbi:hypothetical protein KBA41_03045 [Candidatus Ozemobacteraceae bacterium]|nr:hypothetical protein [Candidatus Ozemobacteraceae bacterium]